MQLNGFCQSPTNASSSQICSTPTSASSSLQGQHPTASSAQSTPHRQPHPVLTSQQSFCYSNSNKRFVHLAKEAVAAANNAGGGAGSAGARSSNTKRMLRMQSLQSMCLTEDHQAKPNFFNLSVGSASGAKLILSSNSLAPFFVLISLFAFDFSLPSFRFFAFFSPRSFFIFDIQCVRFNVVSVLDVCRCSLANTGISSIFSSALSVFRSTSQFAVYLDGFIL